MDAALVPLAPSHPLSFRFLGFSGGCPFKPLKVKTFGRGFEDSPGTIVLSHGF